MKKKELICALAASTLFLGTLTSCDINGVIGKPTETTTNITETNTTETTTNTASDELLNKVFNEFKKSFKNITYDEFIKDVERHDSNQYLNFTYKESYIILYPSYTFKSKKIRIKENDTWYVYESEYKFGEWVLVGKYINTDGNDIPVYVLSAVEYRNGQYYSKDEVFYDGDIKTRINSLYINEEWVYNSKTEYTYDKYNHDLYRTSTYINNEWIVIEERVNYKDHSIIIYSLALNLNGSFNTKYVCEYDKDGNPVKSITAKYVNNEWVTINESTYIDGILNYFYSISLSDDGSFFSKLEYTYDEEGNHLTETYSEYINNGWVKIEEKARYGNELQKVYSVDLNEDGSLSKKEEYTYDLDGNPLSYSYSKYFKNEWVKVREFIWYSNQKCIVYELELDDDSFYTKNEYTYDANGNPLANIYSMYQNNGWKYIFKYERKYDEGTNNVTSAIYYKHNNVEWVYSEKTEYTYNENNECITVIKSSYKNKEWEYTNKWEYTYDEAGNKTNTLEYSYSDGGWVLE